MSVKAKKNKGYEYVKMGKFTLPESTMVILPESMVVILPESKMVNLPEVCP